MGKKISKLQWMSWDIVFMDDIINNDGFIISDPATLNIDGKKERAIYGPSSPLYGSTWGDEQQWMEKYRCECGRFKGLQFRGEICPFCLKKIEAREMDIKKTGWISLGKEKVINPYWYKVLLRIIGKNDFPDIILNSERVDKKGNRSPLIPGKDYDAKNPFACIGIEGFIERFDEIIDYYMRKKKGKRKIVKQLRKAKMNKQAIFTSHIPIYSTALRPQSATSDTFYYTGIDKMINPMVNLSLALVKCEPIEKPYYLSRIQDYLNSIWDFNFDLIDKKEGFIRNKLISGSLNWTSRSVIIPDPTLHQNEVDISYQAFRIKFKYRIIYYIMKMKNISLAEAYYRWVRAYKFDEYVYQIMEYIVRTEKPRIFLNRNPTLNLYSMLLLRIRHVRRDPHRTVLYVPLYILDGLNADFDGDILNAIAVMEEELIHMLRKFDPIERYLMSRDDDKINPYFSISKGRLIDLYHFATFKENERVAGCKLEGEKYDKLLDHIKSMQKQNKPKKDNYPPTKWSDIYP